MIVDMTEYPTLTYAKVDMLAIVCIWTHTGVLYPHYCQAGEKGADIICLLSREIFGMGR